MAIIEATAGTDTPTGPVLPKCDLDVAGHWRCLTHEDSFPSNIAMHSHASHGEHVIGWVCVQHGLEVP